MLFDALRRAVSGAPRSNINANPARRSSQHRICQALGDPDLANGKAQNRHEPTADAVRGLRMANSNFKRSERVSDFLAANGELVESVGKGRKYQALVVWLGAGV